MRHVCKATRGGFWLLVLSLLLGWTTSRTQLVAQNAPLTEKDVLPVVEKCFRCHGENLQMSDLDLRSRDAMLKGGKSGPAIVPGDAEGSLILKRVTGQMQPQMPMAPVPPLTPDEITILKNWIDQGAKWATSVDASSAKPALSAATAGYPNGYKERVITDQDRKWWAFQQPLRNPVPTVSDARWNKNPIDAFVRQTMESKGLEPAPQADKRTLIRRAYLDLVGLLPPSGEVDAFVKDTSPDAYEKLIDRLLASPNYGERWGRFWLDVVRYADSSGFEYDRDIPNAWRYRDYVIKAFNADKPYDQFIIEQLAGDELDNPTNDSLIATTYYRIGPRVRFREKQNPGNRYDYMDDMIRTTYQGFMGLSVNCARCHDHKFDPITRVDYFRAMASFWPYVDVDRPLATQAQVDENERIKNEITQQIAPLRAEINQIERPYREKEQQAKNDETLKRLPEDIRAAVETPEDKRTAGQKLLVSQLRLELPPDDAADLVPPDDPNGVYARAARLIKVSDADDARRGQLLDKIRGLEQRRPAPLPVADGVRDGDYWLTPDGFGDANLPGNGRFVYGKTCCFVPAPGQQYEPPPLYFAANGADFAADAKNPEMKPGFLTVLVNGTKPATAHPPNRPDYPTSGRRRALAEWIASKDNPLTARVIVNRIWGWHFGTGIVATPGNFGKMGVAPSNPELLDWLAIEFVRQNWSVKQMHRLIMTSETYKTASSFYRVKNFETDPTDVYVWRFPIHRVESELVRDLILSASGQLNREAGGKPFFPSVPNAIREAQPRGVWKVTKEEPATWRRSVYAYIQRGLRYPMFDVFDEPDLNVTAERRNVTTVPTQALTLMNNEFVLIQAKFLAERVAKEAGNDLVAQVTQMYRITLSREPTEAELGKNLDFVQTRQEYARAHGAGAGADLLAALTDLAHVMLNLSEFMYIG